MHVSRETTEQTERRLRQVIAGAGLVFLSGDYAFAEFPVAQFPAQLSDRALALIRDEAVWSVLRPAETGDTELFAVFRFHFPPRVDNSGFVGWLASHLKKQLGTGVFVICGHNSARGGIFDYWGAPLALRRQVETELNTLRQSQRKSQ